ncbi:MAG TPA: hypothetical protein VMW88_04195 [Thermoplasmata archaeon]|nr:hypothetical protein [Thermoplasmata archaeon]
MRTETLLGSRAYVEGEEASIDGISENANPYPEDTDENEAWVLGHKGERESRVLGLEDLGTDCFDYDEGEWDEWGDEPLFDFASLDEDEGYD